MSETTISVYPVGVLSDVQTAVRAMRAGQTEHARTKIRSGLRYLAGEARRRDWHGLKTSFNGYLAEIDYPPVGLSFRTCGHGWTKRRAARRLGEYLARDNGVSA